jgi:dihydroorotate dehydrogenase electron transfer subunit
MTLEVGLMASDCRPGEFVHLRSLAPGWPFLRRPFSIYSTDGEGSVEILYKVVGKATGLMADAMPGDVFDVMGPLGKAFTMGTAPGGVVSRVLAVGGGVGIPPLVFFCRHYAAALDGIDLLVGAATAGEIVVPVSLLVEGVRVTYYTEDGSKGNKGLVTDGIEVLLEPGEGVGIIACGPRGMLAETARIAARRGIPCEVSVEEIMACGVGACLSCAVPRAGGGYWHACKDGPVFGSTDIDWERWTAR